MNKTNVIISLVLIFLVVTMTPAYALSISDVLASDVSDRYAVVKWNTNEPSSSTILYGLNGSKLIDVQTDNVFTKNHSVMISPLAANTGYSFNVSSTNKNGTDAKGTFNFMTTLTDTTPPFIDVDLPSFVSEPIINVIGKTEPNTEVYVEVNGALSGSGFMVTGADGAIALSAIRLTATAGAGKEASNQVKITAIDPSKNQNEVIKTVNVDTTPPGITIESPANAKTAFTKDLSAFAWGEQSITIKGNSDEPASMDVYLDGDLVQTLNTSGAWETKPINFKEDRKYTLRFYAVDRAGNVFDQEYVVLLDTKPIELTSNLNDLTPSYVVYRTVRGTTKPGATVIVTVNNQTTSEITTLEGMTNIPASTYEFYERAKSGTLLGDKLDYVDVADENGDFSIDIELTTNFKVENEEAKSVNIDTEDAWKNDVEVTAIDSVGRMKSSGVKRIYYARCGAGGFFTITSPVPSPNSLPEPVVQEGAGQFAMTMDIKWAGPTGVEGVDVTNAKILKQTINPDDKLGRYNLTMGSGNIYKSATLYPSVITADTKQLYAYVSMNPTTHDFGKSKKVIEELQFPLMLELQYTYEVPGQQRSQLITQRKCIDVSIQVEPAITDYFNPNKLVKELSKDLDSIIKQIDNALPYIKKAKNIVAIGCAGSILIQWLKSIGTKWTCRGQDIRDWLLPNEKGEGCTISDDLTCDCGNSEHSGQLLACCQSTVNTLKLQTNIVKPICSRMFCPSVPTFTKHVSSYSDLIVRASTRETTGVSSSVSGVFSKTTGASSKCLVGNSVPAEVSDNNPLGCKSEFNRAWDSAILFDYPIGSEFKLAQEQLSSKKAVPGFFGSLVRGQSKMTNLCSAQDTNEDKIIGITNPKKILGVNQGNPVTPAYRIRTPALTELTGPEEGKEMTEVVDFGYYYQTVVINIPADTVKANVKREESGAVLAGQQPNLGDYVFEQLYGNIQFDRTTGKCAENDKCNEAVKYYGNGGKIPTEVLANLRIKGNKDYVYNPTGGLIAAVKAVCIPAVEAYLTLYRNILVHINSCFKSVADKGKGNSGACRALLSEVVCDFVIDAISCAGKSAVSWASRGPADKSTVWDVSPNPFKAISLAGSSTIESITGSYGNTAAFESLFSERSLMHSVCIGAFTGDFDWNFLGDMFTEVVPVPIKSTCVAFPATRRFISSNPVKQGKPTYLYYSGGMLAAGSDISSLSVQLVCSSDNSCTRYSVSSNPGGKCDCFGGTEKTYQINTDQYAIKQGEVYDEAKYTTIQDAEYRYDKVRVTYTYKDSNGEDKTEKCEAQLKDDSTIPASCKWGEGIGFRCAFSLGDRGYAKFVEGPRAIRDGTQDHIYTIGEPLNLYTKVEVKSPDTSNPQRKWLRFEIKNQKNVLIFSNNFILEEGINEVNFPSGALVAGNSDKREIEASDFGEVLDTSTLDIRNAGGGADITVPTGTKDFSSATESSYFVVLFVNDKYECHTLSVVSGQDVIGGIITGRTPNTNKQVDCNGIKFEISGTPAVGVNPSGALSEYVKGTKAPTAIVVTFKKASGTGSGQCTSDVVDWSGIATLYYSKEGDDTQMSSSKVISDNGVQEQSFVIRTRCKPVYEQVGTESKGEATALEFNVVETTAKAGGTINVNYNVQSPSKKIDKLELQFGDKGPVVPLATVGAFTTGGTQTAQVTVPNGLTGKIDVSLLASIDGKSQNLKKDKEGITIS